MLQAKTLRPAIKGLLTFIPGFQVLLNEKGTGGTNTAEYCYGVWLKHLTLLWENGLRSMPKTVAELGPGDSLGIGLSAMLCGVDNYYALDVIKHADPATNLKIFDELVELFESRAARPLKGWPDYDEYLNDDLFPGHILTDDLLQESLSKTRVAAIRHALANPDDQNNGVSIRYMVPWSDSNVIEKESVDVIFSHSVLEHVVDIDSTYRALYAWLKPGGRMSHQIDYTSHNLSEEWNGYRTYSEFLWKIMLGKRPFMINRQPHSIHVNLLKENGFEIVCEIRNERSDGIQRRQLSAYWSGISDDDLNCAGALLQVTRG